MSNDNNNFANLINQTKQININAADLKPVVCVKCGNRIFIQAVELRHASAFQIGVSGGKNIPFPVFVCANPACGNPHFTVPQPKEDKK